MNSKNKTFLKSLFSDLGYQSKSGKFNLARNLFPYFFGIIVLSSILYKVPFKDIVDSFCNIGWKMILPLSIGGVSLLFYSMSTYILTDKRIPYKTIFYNQLVGDGLNATIPLGIIGEGFKVNHLSKFMPIDKATYTVFYDKLAHGTSGLLFSSLTAGVSCILIPEDSKWKYFLFIASVAFAIYSYFCIYFFFSKAPGKITSFISSKIKLLENIKNETIEAKKVMYGIFFRFCGRLLGLLEFYILLQLLNIPPHINYIFLIATSIIMSATIVLFIPQGLGINEYSILFVFSFLGLDKTAGVTLALIRRIRIIIWGLIGVTTLGTHFLITRFYTKTKH